MTKTEVRRAKAMPRTGSVGVLPESINTDEQKSASSNGLLSPRTHLGATSPVGARVDKKQLLFGLAAFARWAYRR
jgi:hypothetical protein